MAHWQDFSAYEDSLVTRFHNHPFFRRFSDLSDTQLRQFLLEKCALSFHFVSWYDRAINGLYDQEAKQVLKRILQDETPVGKPSHREDLLADLEFIGVPKQKALNFKPSSESRKCKFHLDRLVDYSSHPNHDLQVMVALRTAGEILVAEEYRHVVPELEKRFGLSPSQSRFYAPHFYHDRKEGNDQQMFEHTSSFESVLERMISSQDALDIAQKSALEAYQARVSFYNQFTTPHKIAKATAKVGLALAAGMAVVLGTCLLQSEREKYASFVNSLPLAERQFYTDCDKRLAIQFVQTGNPHYLKYIGTPQAAQEVWGSVP